MVGREKTGEKRRGEEGAVTERRQEEVRGVSQAVKEDRATQKKK